METIPAFPLRIRLLPVGRGINSGNSRISTLSLLMLRILADNPDNALALDNLALLAHRLDGCSNFHVARSFLQLIVVLS
jgi:hypothetical protein